MGLLGNGLIETAPARTFLRAPAMPAGALPIRSIVSRVNSPQPLGNPLVEPAALPGPLLGKKARRLRLSAEKFTV